MNMKQGMFDSVVREAYDDAACPSRHLSQKNHNILILKMIMIITIMIDIS